MKVSNNLEKTKLLCFVFCQCQELTGLHCHLEKLINIAKSYSQIFWFEKGLRNVNRHLSRGSTDKFQTQLYLWKGYNFPLLKTPYILHGNSITFNYTVYHGQKTFNFFFFYSIYPVFFSVKKNCHLQVTMYEPHNINPNQRGLGTKSSSIPTFSSGKIIPFDANS